MSVDKTDIEFETALVFWNEKMRELSIKGKGIHNEVLIIKISPLLEGPYNLKSVNITQLYFATAYFLPGYVRAASIHLQVNKKHRVKGSFFATIHDVNETKVEKEVMGNFEVYL